MSEMIEKYSYKYETVERTKRKDDAYVHNTGWVSTKKKGKNTCK